MREIRVGLILEPPLFDNLGLFTNDVLLSSEEQTSTIQLPYTIKKGKTMTNRLKNEISSYLKYVERKVFSDAEILTKEEIALIYAYSEDRYEGLNEQLRRDLGEIKTEFGRELNTILEKLPNFEGRVYRGTSLNKSRFAIYEDAYKNHTPVIDHAFVSTSKRPSPAKVFMRNSRTDGKVLFEIISRFGKDIEKYAKYDSLEREVLFRPNSSFEVLGINKTGDFITITLNEIREYGTA